MGARVASASESAACERATIDRGTSAAELMQRAGRGAAAHIAENFTDAARAGVRVFTGSGNNGGDGWVVAESLARMGFPTRVTEVAAARTDDSLNAREAALSSGLLQPGDADDNGSLVVDALLGTGSSGSPRGAVADAIRIVLEREGDGTPVISLDLPSGLDATSGAHDLCVRADACISFGTIKRGHLIARDMCGEITVLDIGLMPDGEMANLPLLVDRDWVRARVPRIPPDAHKGTRGRLSVVGGSHGLAGAAILTGEGSLRSGIGVVRLVVEPGNELAVHAGLPAAVVQTWPIEAADTELMVERSDVIAIGPGLGRSRESRELAERTLLAWSGPVVLDADGISVFAGDLDSLAQLLAGRPAVITPHPMELGRLLSIEPAEILNDRFDVGIDVASRLGAAVLLKGTPTVIFSPGGNRYVSALGTAALATGGSGDVLTGMVATLLAQMCSPRRERSSILSEPAGPESISAVDLPAVAAACAAVVHGRAAELCRFVRGTTLDDVLRAMPLAWNEDPVPQPDAVLSRLEAQ